ncbi:unnamed protein product [Bursaphelenchus xylophilus]|uniref:(pine wood nematode) hypothetical protein n=1 Tax=Bursaphelenchus xylophilus TaxID=6326 RepID=A0A1I7RRC2_BURXY|nr:unnamed protein product [Bursaphelenchus xylophilus]CAG9130932.1 unnamed protein product [Bursaphelenchus xylophilus]
MNEEKELNIGQIFSDVSRTVDKVRNMFNGDGQPLRVEAMASTINATSGREKVSSGSPLAGLFGGQSTCFKTCGMDDIQWAARRAGDLFITLQTCTIILTSVLAVCLIICLLVGVSWFYLHERRQRNVDLDHGSSAQSTVLPRFFKESIFSPSKEDDHHDHKSRE